MFGTCVKYRGGVWCFLSHCSSSLHVPSPPPLHSSREWGDMAELSQIDDIKVCSARLKISPILHVSTIFPSLLILDVGILTTEGLWWMIPKSNKQSTSILPWAQQINMHCTPFIPCFLGQNTFWAPNPGVLWSLADVHTYWYIYCLLWEVSWLKAQQLQAPSSQYLKEAQPSDGSSGCLFSAPQLMASWLQPGPEKDADNFCSAVKQALNYVSDTCMLSEA